jgi:hypothetical protein
MPLRSEPAQRVVQRLLEDLRLRFAECEAIHAQFVTEPNGISALAGDFTLFRDGNKRVYRYPVKLPQSGADDAVADAIAEAFDRLAADITRLARLRR